MDPTVAVHSVTNATKFTGSELKAFRKLIPNCSIACVFPARLWPASQLMREGASEATLDASQAAKNFLQWLPFRAI
jgi:hypothetical protein